MSLNGSQLMLDLLAIHPHFSVFRKSTQQQQQQELPREREPDSAHEPATTVIVQTSTQDDLMQSPQHEQSKVDIATTSSPNQTTSSSANDEWHFSMSDASLNFGDSDAGDSFSRTSPSASTTATVRLVNQADLESPPSSHYKRSTSSRKTPRPTTLVQFSPLSVAPSPLLATSMPPPIPSPFDDEIVVTAQLPVSALKKTILKLPRTPGTGQSVRFSASTTTATSPTSPSYTNGSRSVVSSVSTRPTSAPSSEHGTASFDYSAEFAGVEQSFGEDEPSSIADGSSHTVATFLSKLQAAIPSPDSSLIHQALPATNDTLSASTLHSGQRQSATQGDRETQFVDSLASTIVPVSLELREHVSPFLFDESNPFTSESVSLTPSNHSTSNLSNDGFEEHCHQIVWPNVSATSNELASSSFAPTTPTRLGDSMYQASPTMRIQSSDSAIAAAASARSVCATATDVKTSNPPSPAGNSLGNRSLPMSDTKASNAIYMTEPASQANQTFPQAQRNEDTRSTLSSSASRFYRLFLEKRAKDSAVAADELGRIVMQEQQQDLTSLATALDGDGNLLPLTLAPVVQDRDDQQQEEASAELYDQDTSVVDDDRTHDLSVYATPRGEQTLGRISETTVFYSPEQDAQHDQEIYDEKTATQLIRVHEEEEESFDADALLQSDADTMEEHESMIRATFLSPIPEMSEPNTTVSSMSAFADSPLAADNASASPVPRAPSSFPDSNSTAGDNSLTLYRSTPDARVSRLTNALKLAPAASFNPFALSGAVHESSRVDSAKTADLRLIQSLLSAQGDLISNSSTQKFLLTSLVSNMRDDSERDGRIIANLKAQVTELEQAWEDACETVKTLETSHTKSPNMSREHEKRQALQDVVDKLSTELETRTRLDKQRRKQQEVELASLHKDVTKLKSIVRDTDIRLRHAQVGQAEADDQRDHFKTVVEKLTEENELLRREREQARSHARDQIIDRDRTISMLRIELAGAHVSASPAPDRQTKIVGQLEEAQKQLTETVDRLREQLSDADFQSASLRDDNRNLQTELADLRQSALHDQRQLEDVIVESRADAARLRQSLIDAERVATSTRDELDATRDRLETVELELERLGDDSKLKEDKIHMQRSAWDEHQTVMADLLESIARLESETATKEAQLSQLRQELQDARRDMHNMVEARDRHLQETETALSAKIAKNEALVAECNRLGAKVAQHDGLQSECARLRETVATLQKHSADREVKYQRMKKIKSEQDDDILSLNIALQAKQQEASTWKRQLQAIRRSGTSYGATPAFATSHSVVTRSSRRNVSTSRDSQVLTSSTGTVNVQDTPLPTRVARLKSSRPTRARTSLPRLSPGETVVVVHEDDEAKAADAATLSVSSKWTRPVVDLVAGQSSVRAPSRGDRSQARMSSASQLVIQLKENTQPRSRVSMLA
ncbi:hypothetical protein OIO90_004407 [Microbotryomycetes sp. JL221]|nr:hypothetical protein OIO90_004407 [Microbotryomycetes sp. JL221]